MPKLSGIGISLQDPGEEDSSLEPGLYQTGAAGLVFLGVTAGMGILIGVVAGGLLTL